MPVRARTHGFSFMELLVVLAILGVITGMVVPVYTGSMQSARFRNAHLDFLSTLRYVQEVSVRESRVYRLYVDQDEHRYWVMERITPPLNEWGIRQPYGLDDDRIGGGEDAFYRPVAAQFGRLQRLPEFIQFARIDAREDRGRGAHYITCYPNGASDRARITLADSRDRSLTREIRVAGVMGVFEENRRVAGFS